MNRKTFFVIVALCSDLLLFYAALIAILALRYWPQDFVLAYARHILPFTATFVIWLLVFGAFGLYDLRLMKNNRIFLERLLEATALNIILAIILFYLFPLVIEPRRNLVLIAILGFVLISSWRYLFNILILKTPAHRVLFFAPTQEASALADWLQKNPQLGQKPVAFIHNGAGTENVLAGMENFYFKNNLVSIVNKTAADTIVISRATKENKELVKELFRVIPRGVSVLEFSSFYEKLVGKVPHSLIEESWFLENLIGTEKPRYEFLKRALDLLLAATIGIIAVLLLPPIAFVIILSRPSNLVRYRSRRARPGDGLVFFRQKRVGKSGRLFEFIKFRSQILGAEKMSEAKEMSEDGRQYAVGKILRKTYLDELPQVWNVFKGDMSFVGPRPERPEYVEELKTKVPFYEMRLLVLPGITGWAQINMENDASVQDAPEKMQYDLYYIKNRSLGLDLAILLKTFFTILKRQGR